MQMLLAHNHQFIDYKGIQDFDLILHLSVVQDVIGWSLQMSWIKAISFWTELAAHWFIAWNIYDCITWTSKINAQEETKTITENSIKNKEIPSPYDAIVRGEEMSFWESEAISFRVTSSTGFKKSSTGFLRVDGRHFLARLTLAFQP